MDPRELVEWLREEMKELRTDVGEIKTTQAEMQKDVSYHIKRTDLLEQRVEQVADLGKKAMGAWWLVGAVGVVAGAFAGLRTLLG